MTEADHRRLSTAGAQQKVITLSGRDLEDAKRLLRLLSGEPSSGSNLPQVLHDRIHGDRAKLERRARQILDLRVRRVERFGRAMFGEPAWEMLLVLYATGDTRLTVNRLIKLSGASKATAIRWLDYLADQGLISRETHPTDLRRLFVVLTEKGTASLNAYLSQTGELDA